MGKCGDLCVGCQLRIPAPSKCYGLVDSPVGLAGWIFEKMWAWTDNQGSPFDALSKDTILDNIMSYWLGAAGASSARLYWESFAKIGDGKVFISPMEGAVRIRTSETDEGAV